MEEIERDLIYYDDVKGRFGLYEETDEFVGVFGQGWILGKENKHKVRWIFWFCFYHFLVEITFLFLGNNNNNNLLMIIENPFVYIKSFNNNNNNLGSFLFLSL
jgi:hypothetical protein